MFETPQEMAARADRVMAKCRERGQASLENLKNGIHQLVDECESLLAVRAEILASFAELSDEFGILDLGGGLFQAKDEPNRMRRENMAVAVEVRARGVFDLGSSRPARLMRRQVGGWVEIPADVTPDDIVPGWSVRKTTEPKDEN